MVTLDDVDLLAGTWEAGVPHEMFDLLRREAPVFWHAEPEGRGFWALTKHADVLGVSRDPGRFSSELGATFIDDQTDESLAAMRLSILNMDPPKHNRYRKLVSRGFTPRVIANLNEAIERRAARIVDDVADKGECDFVEDIAAKLPLEIICEMIGLPEADWPRMFELSNTMVGFDDPDYQATPEDGAAAAMEIFGYCDQIAQERRADPREDIMTALVSAELEGERLDDLELNLFFVTLVVAGNETTRNLINHSMLALLDNPSEVGAAAGGPRAVADGRRGDVAVGDVHPQLPAHGHRRRDDPRAADRRRRQGRHVLHVRQPGRGRVHRPAPLRRGPGPEPARHLRRRRRAPLPRRQPRPGRDRGDHAARRRRARRRRAGRAGAAVAERLREWRERDADSLPSPDVIDRSSTSFVKIHGHDVAYRSGGPADAPVVVLVHGIAGSSSTWAPVMDRLADSYRVISPDLLGHGESAKPRGDYSLGAYACGIRDLLAVLDVDRATFVGHSLGGGIAMQLAYQFPEHCERLALVASGGLGKEVSGLLRLLSAPGSEYVLPLFLNSRLHGVAAPVWRALGVLRLRGDTLLEELWATWSRLTDSRAQRAFVHTLRAVVDVAGQRVSARDRLYLAREVPTMIVWGDRDRVIPVEHAPAAHALMPGSRLEIVPGAGHFLPIERPDLVASLLRDFIETTHAASVTPDQWHEVLTGASGPSRGSRMDPARAGRRSQGRRRSPGRPPGEEEDAASGGQTCRSRRMTSGSGHHYAGAASASVATLTAQG